MPTWRERPSSVRPMLASLEEAPLEGADLAYEPKYDGIRALVHVEPPAGGARAATAERHPPARVTIWSRLGNDKTSQFPEIVDTIARWGRTLPGPVMLDGEIVALDASGKPAGFQQLQNRIHLTEAGPAPGATAFIAFDLLREGHEDLRPLPLAARRARLEHLLRHPVGPVLRLSEYVPHDGRALRARAAQQGWEGLIVKRIDSVYKSGKRTPDWRKVKLVKRQECVIGGWTEPRGARRFFGALLLGVYDDSGALVYAGHTGTGFSHQELERVWKRLTPLETAECPFAVRPRTNERPHWVEPRLVAEIKFTEWTADGKLRHPVYMGLRDDKRPESVRREDWSAALRPASGGSGSRDTHPAPHRPRRPAASGDVGWSGAADHRARSTRLRARAAVAPAEARNSVAVEREAGGRGSATAAPAGAGRLGRPGSRLGARRSGLGKHGGQAFRRALRAVEIGEVMSALREIEQSRRDGVLELPGGAQVPVSSLHKTFWPDLQLTKGDLLRYYVQVAPVLLPVVADRPLVMRRFPNGIRGKAFYQQKAPDDVPAGVRVERVSADTEVPSRLVGGSLATLLYMAQLAAISQDPWFSRVQSPEEPDYAALDLDPAEGVPFARVLDAARAIHDELSRLGIPAVPKTSGASGLHVYIPLPAGTPYEAGLLFCQIVATAVARRHPRIATVERAVRARGKRVYLDYLQNIRGKTLASAYSARATEFAGVSAPLTWKEVEEGVDPQEFTLKTMPARLEAQGDLWAPIRTGPKADLRALTR